MTLALRRTVFLDGEKRPDDFEVRYRGQTVGRFYRMRSTSRNTGRAAARMVVWRMPCRFRHPVVVLEDPAQRRPGPPDRTGSASRTNADEEDFIVAGPQQQLS
jgi:hypothetical protein